MRLLRNSVVLVCLCLVLAASAASAMEGPSMPDHRQISMVVRIVRDLQAFLKAVWDNEGAQIDPLGGTSHLKGGPVQEAPGTDEGFQIDPWG